MTRILGILAVLGALAAVSPTDTARAAEYTMRLHHLSPPVSAMQPALSSGRGPSESTSSPASD